MVSPSLPAPSCRWRRSCARPMHTPCISVRRRWPCRASIAPAWNPSWPIARRGAAKARPRRGLVEGDERHGARVVDLGESRHEGMSEFLDRREEPQPQVVHRDVLEKAAHQGLILRAHRTDENAPALAEHEVAFPLAWIGPNCE